MEAVDFYQAHNHNHLTIAKELMELFSKIVGEELVGSALDVGCGDGAVSVQVLRARHPRLRLAACDVSPAMLQHARRKYAQHDVDFIQLDITADLHVAQRYDYIFSFYCFHHFANQRKAIRNIYDLLNPGGTCMIVTMVDAIPYRAVDFLSKTEKWSKYFSTVDNIAPPLMHSKDPEGEYQQLFMAVGFDILHVNRNKFPCHFEDTNSLSDMIKTVEYGRKYIPKDKLELYHKDIDKMLFDYCIHYINDKPSFYADTLAIIVRRRS